MYFEEDHLYHVFNQGNNKQQIFFKEDNYLFFLKKIRTHISPYAEVLAYCLMPNHFHLMIKVSRVEVDISEGFVQNETLAKVACKRTLNQSIGIMLRSYTCAINKQEGMSGSLFRKETKAQCLTQRDRISPAYFNTTFGANLNIDIAEFNYSKRCFNYIHENPVGAALVGKAEEWIFCSAPDYAGLRNGTLVNKSTAKDEGLI